MDVLFQLIQQTEFLYILIAFAGAAIVSELRNRNGGRKKKLYRLLGEWCFTIIVSTTIFLVAYPFLKDYEYGVTILFALDMLISSFGGDKTYRAITRILSDTDFSKLANKTVSLLEVVIRILKAAAEDDDTS